MEEHTPRGLARKGLAYTQWGKEIYTTRKEHTKGEEIHTLSGYYTPKELKDTRKELKDTRKELKDTRRGHTRRDHRHGGDEPAVDSLRIGPLMCFHTEMLARLDTSAITLIILLTFSVH